ncbi:MAG: ATPase domain-containing protein [Candidatus ainarchaeum sp.]|nr:ATPase domain-containing protein [Candidatus ainarchaeum sp.]
MAENKRPKIVPQLRRVQAGIPGLDRLVEGGLVENSLVVLRGDTGTGKTIFALQFIYEGITKYNAPGLYLSFNEDKEATYAHGMEFGWDFRKLEEDGKFAFIHYEPHEVVRVMEEGGGTIRDQLEAIRARRLVVDPITPFTMVFNDPYKENEAIMELFSMFRNWNCTALIISDARASLTGGEKTERAVVLADAVINMYYTREGPSRARMLEVLKMKDTAHTERLIPFVFTSGGLEVHDGKQRK